MLQLHTLALVVLLAAQTPVPVGEQATVSIQGRITGPAGQAIANAQIVASSSRLQVTRETRSDAQGNYSLQRIPVGVYEIRVSARDFPTEVKQLSLTAGQNSHADFKLGSQPPAPAPDVVPVADARATGAVVEVLKNTFDNDLALQTWLNDQAGRGRRLLSVIPSDLKESYFLFGNGRDDRSIIVMTVTSPLDARDLRHGWH